MTPDAHLDTSGLRCPLPVLKLRKRLQDLSPGAVIEVLADDPIARIDIPHYCQEAGHRLISQDEDAGGTQRYRIEKGGIDQTPSPGL